MAGDEPTPDQALEGIVDGGQAFERVQALDALLQLSGGLGAAQHQHRQQRDLRRVEAERLVEEVAVLAGAAAGATRESGPAAQREVAQGLDDVLLLV